MLIHVSNCLINSDPDEEEWLLPSIIWFIRIIIILIRITASPKISNNNENNNNNKKKKKTYSNEN